MLSNASVGHVGDWVGDWGDCAFAHRRWSGFARNLASRLRHSGTINYRKGRGMTWKPVSTEQYELFEQIMLWIRTVRAAGEKYGLIGYDKDWLPSHADFAKSALFERIRSGLQPMDEPPPVGFACPWYALVEDAGPHWIMEVCSSSFPGEDDLLIVNQNAFRIYERLDEQEFIVGDRRGTSYRFRLWFDADWRHPTAGHLTRFQGGWFMQNVALASADTHPKDGDVQQAPLVSGAVPKADAQTQGGTK